MSSPFVITEACIDTKDKGCVDVCPVDCIYEYDSEKNVLFSPGDTHTPKPNFISIFEDRMLYINPDECTSCNACISECPVGAIYTEDTLPDGLKRKSYNLTDTKKGNDHTFFAELNREVFAD